MSSDGFTARRREPVSPGLRAVVCMSEADEVAAVEAILRDHAITVVAEASQGSEAMALVALFEADIVVLELALLGQFGVRLIPVFAKVAPDCALVVISPMRTLDVTVVEAGADAVVPAADLRSLRGVLADVIVARRRERLSSPAAGG